MFPAAFRSTFGTAAAAHPARAFSTTARQQVARMTLVGRLGTTPEEVAINGDRTLVRYVIGTSHGRGEDKKTSWFRVASFLHGPQKDFLLSVPKGSMLHVDAEARMDTYTDSEGAKRSNLSLVARTFDVLQRARVEESDATDEGLVQEGSG